MCADHEDPPRGGTSNSFYRNFADGEGLLPVRLLRASLNLLRRVPRRAGCCGRYGEPGC